MLTVAEAASGGLYVMTQCLYEEAWGNLTKVIQDPGTGKVNRTTLMACDVAGTKVVASVTDSVRGTVSYTTALSGERLTMVLPGGAIWTCSYETNGALPVRSQHDPNTMTRNLSRVTDDQNRKVEYWLDNYGAVKRVRSNQTFDAGGTLLAYQKTEYMAELASGVYSRGNLWRVKNTWHVWQAKCSQ